jgi:hypothetical protein
MPDPELLALRDRIDVLERRVQELMSIVKYLQSRNLPRVENPLDAKAVQEKSVFDWQGPR